jgi:hypothetical protein
MRAEIVVWRSQDDRTVNLKHRLPVLIQFFDIAVFHCPDAFFRNLKCVSEFLIKHKAIATVFVFLVGDHGSARCLPRKLEGKSGLTVGKPLADNGDRNASSIHWNDRHTDAAPLL